MFSVLKTRIFQKYRTTKYPDISPVMPDRFRGLPEHHSALCKNNCRDCINSCPVNAISKHAPTTLTIDLGKCIFCGECANICPDKAIKFSQEHRMTVNNPADLLILSDEEFKHAESLKEELLKIFGRSFKLRQVSAGGCNACEADVNVLSTVGFDLARFGISFVASPRHADGLLVTGPVTRNMEEALLKTYDALPAPKVVLAVGACAISGGLFTAHEEISKDWQKTVPVNFFIPGCPPHPLTILDGLLTVIRKNKTTAI